MASVTADSHTDIPVSRQIPALMLSQQRTRRAHEWLTTLLSAVMPAAHVIYPKADARPAGFSEQWLTYIRGCFGGTFSDDLSWLAPASARRPTGQRYTQVLPRSPTPAATWCCCAIRR
jgi:beta-glucosidase-like glycosyl hydrolase